MKAIVTKAFDGVRDGEATPRAFAVGDEVEGDLAETAIRHKQAKKVPAAAEEPEPPAAREIPRTPEHKAEARAEFDRLTDDDVLKAASGFKVDVSQGIGDRAAIFDKIYDAAFPAEAPKA